MLNKIQKAGFGLFIAALSVSAFALQEGFNLKRAAKAGETIKFRLKATLEMAGQEVNFSTLVTEKVAKVETNGDYVVESTQTTSKVMTPDGEMDMPDESQTYTYKATGEVVEIKSKDAGPNVYRTSNLQSFVATDKPVKVGDTWTSEYKKDEKTGAVAGKGSYKVEAEEKVAEFETFKIKFTTKETEGGEAAATHDCTIWINKKDGTVVKVEGTFKNVPFPGAQGPVNAKYTLVRES